MPKNTSGKKTYTRWWSELLCNCLLLFFISGNNFAQTSVQQQNKSVQNINSPVKTVKSPELPTPPTLVYVSIDSETDEVYVEWIPSIDESTIRYRVQEMAVSGPNSQNFPISPYVVGRTTIYTKFIYEKALISPVLFNLVSYSDINMDVGGPRSVPSHQSVFASLEYDSCNASIKVKWTPYIGWGDKLTNYKVLLYESIGINPEISGDIDTSKREYIIKDILGEKIQENREYKIMVWAYNSSIGKASRSNKDSIFTKKSLPPSYLHGKSTDNSIQNLVDLNFNVDRNAISDSYRLYRSLASEDNYKIITDLYKNEDGTVTYTDALPSSNVYNYKLVYLDGCKNEGISSIPINNILLKGKSQSMTNNLSWNQFNTWVQGTNEVHIYRNSSVASNELLATVSSSITEYSDIINAQDQLSGDLCYQVEFVSNPDPIDGKVNKTLSNLFCVNMLGQVFVPNAFTPNNDGQNDEFKPTFAILPARYTFIIYNRYGSKIFETNNVSEGWNGILSDGKKALEGAYIYFIKLENGAGEVLEKRGNFTIIYP